MAKDLRSSAIRMPRIIHRERSEYTERARLAGVEGIVSVSVIVDSNGTVHGILVLRPLSHGLTESALEAASKCRFEPATRDGHPISMRVEIHSAYVQQPAIPRRRQQYARSHLLNLLFFPLSDPLLPWVLMFWAPAFFRRPAC